MGREKPDIKAQKCIYDNNARKNGATTNFLPIHLAHTLFFTPQPRIRFFRVLNFLLSLSLHPALSVRKPLIFNEYHRNWILEIVTQMYTQHTPAELRYGEHLNQSQLLHLFFRVESTFRRMKAIEIGWEQGAKATPYLLTYHVTKPISKIIFPLCAGFRSIESSSALTFQQRTT